mgnify:CR=1 FL=1
MSEPLKLAVQLAALTAVIAGILILFGAGWQRIRKLVIASTLPHSLVRRLPPILV